MALTSPRNLSVGAIFIVLIYIFLNLPQSPIVPVNGYPGEFHLIFMLVLGALIGSAAFNFATSELMETEGVRNVFDIGFKRLFGSFLFAILIAIGYDGFTLILVEMFSGEDVTIVSTIEFSQIILQIIIGFLVIYPFFQFLNLARPGEDSSIPAEYPLEAMMEKLRGIFNSPFIAAVFAYGITYILPIFALVQFFEDFRLAVLLWALVLPLISLGALAGAGFGEDLIRLRLIRRPIRDLPKLGLPKINLREYNFEIGGLILVLIAIQALITTAYFGITGLGTALGIRNPSLQQVQTTILLLTFFNKGRGAFKELKEVWTETGFKVNVFQLFLPVFVFLGVILSSMLEVFVQQAANATGVLVTIGLDRHVQLASFILVVQNFVLIFTALFILRRTPGAAERRLIKEVPEFYSEDPTGYLYIYDKLKYDRSIENLIKEATNHKNELKEDSQVLLNLIEEGLKNDDKDVQIVAAEALHSLVEDMDKFDDDLYELNKLAIQSSSVGARIYGIRGMKVFLKYLEGVEKENAISLLQSYLGDEDPVISWDTSIVLQRILMEDPEYRSFVLALTIKTLNTTTQKSSLDAITRFFNKIAKDSTEIGQMAISTLAIQLSTGDNEHPENLIDGIKSLLRGNPLLVDDLIDQVAVGIDHPDLEFRKNSYQVLANMAQYGTGSEQDILELILNGINDDSHEIQEIAYDALTKEVSNAPYLADQIYGILLSKFDELRGVPLIGALNVIKSIVNLNVNLENEILEMIKGAAKSSTPEVRELVLEILGEIVLDEPKNAEVIYNIAVDNLDHSSENVRQEAVTTLGKVVVANSNTAQSVYREVKKARDDTSFIVQLAAIEALGFVASATTQYADEIVTELNPLLDDEDWQVRLAAFNGLFASVQTRKGLTDHLVNAIKIALFDADRTVRQRSLDAVNWIAENHRRKTDEILQFINKNMKKHKSDIQTNLVNALEIIAADNILSIPIVLNNLEYAYISDNNNLRFASNEALKTALEKLAGTRDISSQARKALNSLLTNLLKAANHSNTAIRKSAYEAITEICAKLPEIKVADRGRNAIEKAIKLEKDVGLQEVLEEARIRAKKPLDLSTLN